MVTREVLHGHRIEVETGGYVSFDVQLTNSPHRHDYYELCLALSGRGDYWHGKHQFPIRPGTVFLAEPGVIHEIASFKSKDLSLYFVTMTLHQIGGATRSELHPVLASFEREHKIAVDGCEMLANYIPLIESPDSGRSFAAQSALKMFALEMMNRLCVRPVEETQKQSGDDLARALELVDRNLNRTISVEEVADDLGMSARTLRRRFASQAGMNLASEINHRRMRHAAHRLLMGFTVQEVADYIGINSAAQFTRSFKRAFGKGPKQFQTSYRPGTLAKRTRPDDDID